ncbi:MAG: methyltransferase domain-containing protein [Burkholderiales bacterium]|nr:methyltransferase domain-containing protein [Burkholderiales bacterium]
MNDSFDPAQVAKNASQAEKALAFFMRFLARPKQVGSVAPSSGFLERRLVRMGAVAEARTVVELGPGTGGTTQALLNAMPREGRLLAIEIDRRFTELVRTEIADPRLIAHEGSAEHIAGTLARYSLPAPDVVISGIPFSTMPRHVGESILHAIRQVLAPGGRFVAYQLRDRVAVLGRGVFGSAEIADVELLNIPPIRVYCWRK